jgi:hypothetical protein
LQVATLAVPRNPASIDEIQAVYDELSRRFRSELYVTRQAQPSCLPGPTQDASPPANGADPLA